MISILLINQNQTFDRFIMMQRSLVLLVFVITCIHPVFSQVNYRHFVTAGRIELSEDRNTEAIRNFNTAIQARPDHFEAWFFRGIAKFNLNDYAGSLNDFNETIRLHPLYARAYHYRGIVNDRMTNYYDAKTDFKKALEIDPYNAELYVAAGATDMHLDDFESAIKNYDMALLIYPRLSNAWLNRGIAKRLSGLKEEALSDLDKAVFHDHFDSEAWVRRGILRSELNDFEGALSDLDQALKLDAQNPAVYFQRAHIRLLQGDTLQALNDFEQVNILDTRNALTYYNRALIHSLRNELPEAKVLYQQVILINPTNIYSHFNLGVINFQMEQYREAEKDFTNAIDLFPGFVGALVNRSLVRKQLKDRSGSEADYAKALVIIQDLDDSNADPETLFGRYADSTYFNQIIALEADFISGNMAQQRPQFRNVDIKPFRNFVISFKPTQEKTSANQLPGYTDLTIQHLNSSLPELLHLTYMCQNQQFESNDLQNQENLLKDSKLPYNEQQLLIGVLNQARNNLSRSLTHYASIPNNDPLGLQARMNEAVVLFDQEEGRVLSENDVRAVTIQQGSATPVQSESKADQTLNLIPAFNAIKQALQIAPKNAFAIYNKGNFLLQTGAFHPAIDAFSDAIAIEPTMGEAYYNRALTLLYLNENRLACDDLSKAGELGITESYAVIRKYCTAK